MEIGEFFWPHPCLFRDIILSFFYFQLVLKLEFYSRTYFLKYIQSNIILYSTKEHTDNNQEIDL